ncbi:MAG: radical SAM protein [Methanobacteriota archaeon]|nr:MAG: radical SAM protein [Euryarchaeota archaeon]
MARDPLDRYWMILGGEAEARYLTSKQTMMDVDLRSDTETLWAIHSSAAPSKKSQGEVSLLDLKAELAGRMLSDCTMCERSCHANRACGEAGHCGVLDTRISSEFLHMGEEPELVPSHTIFFSGCTFDCVYCQNYDISTNPVSGMMIPPDLLSKAIEKRAMNDAGKVHQLNLPAASKNVNWVGGDPTSNLAFILRTLSECDVNLPQVWNSNMYLTERTLELLDGAIDVYLTDFKYGNDICAKRLSGIDRYMEVTQRNHQIARAQAEMIIRHLVLPSHLECCTRPILTWIAKNLKEVKVNVMGQYRPAHRAQGFKDISRSIRVSEYESALRIAEELELDLCA